MTNEDFQVTRPYPSRLQLLGQTLWPSFRRVLAAIFSIIGLPLFLLAVLGSSKMLADLGVLDVGETAGRLLAIYDSVQDWLFQQISEMGVTIPVLILNALVVYISIGNTVARSERGEILAVQLERSEWKASFMDAFRRGRIASMFYIVPRFLRGIFVRVLWPLIGLYRLGTPFVVEGPGPSGDEISSSVPRTAIQDFAQMVTDSGGWDAQVVYDQRQILIWHVTLVSGGSWAIGFVTSLVGSG